MKKLFTLVLAAFALSTTAVYAQCTPDFTIVDPELRPDADSLACATQGSPYDATIYLKNFTTVSGFRVDSLIVDSITNTPCGLYYRLNKPNKTYLNGEVGCLRVNGTTSDAVGQYQLGIYVKVYATPDLPGIEGVSTPAATLASLGGLDFRYWIRVKASAAPCDTIDETPGSPKNKTASCRGNNDRTGIDNLVSAINGFEIAPNPSSNMAYVNFVSNVEGQFNVVISNMIGEVVKNEKVTIIKGDNSLDVNLSSFDNGIYFFVYRDWETG